MSSSVSLVMSLAFLGAGTDPPDLRCGANCLYVSLKALDVDGVSFDEVQRKLGAPAPSGYSFGQLADVAKSYGVQTLGVKTSVNNLRLREAPFACIALIRETHYVNFSEVGEREVHIVDAPREYTLPLETLPSVWNGEALLIARQALIAEEELGRSGRIVRFVVIGISTLLLGGLGWVFVRRQRKQA